MAESPTTLTESPDSELIERSRAGETRAFAELWRRHYRPAIRAARQFTTIDADDLVSEAYARIYQRVLAGGGPTGAFRPYLYTTIRNLAASWGRSSKDVSVDMITEDFEDERIPADPATEALDRSLTANAFRALPERWQTVLWYTEVEGMDPHEVAPLMGLTANGVAALSYRAREGLRKAWLQAHISTAGIGDDCRWAMSKLGEHARDGLATRERSRLEAHLATCSKCQVVSEEVSEVGSHLATVMIPLVLGATAGGGLLAVLGSGGAEATTGPLAQIIPELPDRVQQVGEVSAVAAPVAGGLFVGGSAASSTGVVAGGVVLAAALTGGAVVSGTVAADAEAADVGSSAAASAATADDDSVIPADDAEDDPIALPSESPDPSALPDDLTDDSDGGGESGTGGRLRDTIDEVTDDLVDDVVDTITDDSGSVATVNLTLSGTGTPGATLSLQAAGVVYATTTVGENGTYSLNVTGLPGGLESLKLVQEVDESLLDGLLGSVTDLLAPLSLDAVGGSGSGISIVLVD